MKFISILFPPSETITIGKQSSARFFPAFALTNALL